MHRMTLKLSLLVALITVIVVGVYIRQPTRPTEDESRFIQACNNLNGKELTFENIKLFNGACAYLSDDGGVGIERCTDRHVRQYIQEKKEGKFIPYGDGSFAIWQKDDLNNVWICKITAFEPVIKAASEYYTD